jgi:N-acetylmuramic acid 6-phosphate etherase
MINAERAAVRVAAPTERRNPRSADLDLMPTLDVPRIINEADREVPDAVAAVGDRIAGAVEVAAAALRAGHRVHYFGAGTSGRIGVIDAAEMPPTFSSPDTWFCAHLAGGAEAMWRAVEDAEDDPAAGGAEATACVQAGDVVVGLAASGRTPYVLGALAEASSRGARTLEPHGGDGRDQRQAARPDDLDLDGRHRLLGGRVPAVAERRRR